MASIEDPDKITARKESVSERVTISIFGDAPLTDTERRFLAAAEGGNLREILQCLEENGIVNVNCRDYLGRSALQLAVLGEHPDVVLYLLDRCKLDIIEDALMHAIKNNLIKLCELILNHSVYSNKRHRLKLEFQHEFYDQDEDNPFFSSDLKPIIVAAHCNNFDIVYMLLQRGFYIKWPHDFFCTCTECKNHLEFDRVVHSRSRLNAFRGLASTAYMSLSTDDPIMTAFRLSRQLEHLSETEKQYKGEYTSLTKQCKDYGVALFSLCRTSEEVQAALHGDAEVTDLSRIKLAIRYEQKKFVAHANCQEHLMTMWYGDLSLVRHLSTLKKTMLIPLAVIAMPFIATGYYLAPRSEFGRILRVPFIKFVNHSVSHCIFLLLLFITTEREYLIAQGHKHKYYFVGRYGIVNIVIMVYVAGMFWGECKQLWDEGLYGYLNDLWNFVDIMMIALYAASYSTQLVIFIKFRDFELDHTANPIIVANVLFAMANVLSFCRIAFLLPASETFGQLQISYGRMLQDVFKFIVIYMMVIFAFVCGLTTLYDVYDNQNEHFNNPVNSFLSLYWSTFGMGNSKAPKLTSSEPNDNQKSLTVITGSILYIVYILGAVVVLINMLIAMMSHTFQEIQDEEDVEWKFARAKLWMFYIQEGNTLPVPFNVLPSPKTLWKFALLFKKWLMGTADEISEKPKIFVRDHKSIVHRVVLRYIHQMKFGRKREGLADDITEAKEETLNMVHKLYQSTHRRLNTIAEDVRNLQADVSHLHYRVRDRQPLPYSGVTYRP